MKYIGYARVSTKEQKIDRQIHNIVKYCEKESIALYKSKVYQEFYTGKKYDRPQYTVVKELLEPGDALIISELDRLGRTKDGIKEELKYLKDNNIRIISLDIPTTQIDLSQYTEDLAKLMIEMINSILLEVFAAMAEAEIKRKEKRQREGIEAMKSRGDWDKYGRPWKMPLDKFEVLYQQVLDGKKKPGEVMKENNLKEGTYYRYKSLIDKRKKLNAGSENKLVEPVCEEITHGGNGKDNVIELEIIEDFVDDEVETYYEDDELV